MTVAEIQRALKARGYDLGTGGPSRDGVDGAWGRLSISAAKAFQRLKGLPESGLYDETTIKALNAETAIGGPVARLVSGSIAPPWYLEARRKMGLHEVQNRSALMAWLKSDGKTLGDPAKLPWCGDFVETCIALTLPAEPMVANPYFATNWLGFGVSLVRPSIGAVLVFKRPGGGHVGFYAGERPDAHRVLGGNQSNRVSETWVAKARCVGIRWPRTAPKPTGGPVVLANAVGVLSRNEA